MKYFVGVRATQRVQVPPRSTFASSRQVTLLLASCRSDFQKIVAKIMKLEYRIPDKLNLTPCVKDLLARIFVKDPAQRITIAEIKQHGWYLHRLPYELQEGYKGFERCVPLFRNNACDAPTSALKHVQLVWQVAVSARL